MPEKDEEWRTNPGETIPYLTNQQLLRRVNPRGSRSQKKKPEAIQAEKSIILKDDNVSDKLDIFITSVSNRKEDYKEFNSRLALLETQVERAGEFR